MSSMSCCQNHCHIAYLFYRHSFSKPLMENTRGCISLHPDNNSFFYPILVLECNPNAEMMFWLDVVKLNKEVYSTPFVLPDLASDHSSSFTEQLMQFLLKCSKESNQNIFSFRDLCSKSRVQEIAQASLDSGVNDQVGNHTISPLPTPCCVLDESSE